MAQDKSPNDSQPNTAKDQEPKPTPTPQGPTIVAEAVISPEGEQVQLEGLPADLIVEANLYDDVIVRSPSEEVLVEDNLIKIRQESGGFTTRAPGFGDTRGEAVVIRAENVSDSSSLKAFQQFGIQVDTIINGTAGNDALMGDESNNLLFGLGGNDLLAGGDGRDILFGGDGNDMLFGDSLVMSMTARMSLIATAMLEPASFSFQLPPVTNTARTQMASNPIVTESTPQVSVLEKVTTQFSPIISQPLENKSPSLLFANDTQTEIKETISMPKMLSEQISQDPSTSLSHTEANLTNHNWNNEVFSATSSYSSNWVTIDREAVFKHLALNTGEDTQFNDVLDGGAGSDHVFGGLGSDVVFFTLAENIGSQDYADGGPGQDELIIRVTENELNNNAFQSDINQFSQYLNTSQSASPFKFTSFNLTVNSIEKLSINVLDEDDALSLETLSHNAAEQQLDFDKLIVSNDFTGLTGALRKLSGVEAGDIFEDYDRPISQHAPLESQNDVTTGQFVALSMTSVMDSLLDTFEANIDDLVIM